MADELVDFRGRISMRSSCAIEARAVATGRERQEIVREILDAWTAEQVHAASLLHRAQGFPESYVIDRGADGHPLSKAAQVRMCGNSVSPPVATAIVSANFMDQRQTLRDAA